MNDIYEQCSSVEKLDFEIAAFSRHLHGERKEAAILKLISFSIASFLY